MVETILPDVYIDVRPEGLIVPARISVGTVGVVGTASRGPIGKAVVLGDYPGARAVFGDYDAWADGAATLTLTRALQLVFAGGATTVIGVRVAAANADGTTVAVPASAAVASPTGRAATLSASTPGTWGNGIELEVGEAVEDPYITDEEHAGGDLTLDRTPVLPSARNRVRWFDSTTGVTRDLEVVYDDHPSAPTTDQVKVTKASGAMAFGAAIHGGDQITASYLVARESAVTVTVRHRGPTGLVEESYTVVDGADLVSSVTDAGSALVTAEAGDQPAERPTSTTGPVPFTGGSDGAIGASYDDGLEVLLGADAHIVVAAGQDETFASSLVAHCATASTDARKRDRIAVVGSRRGATLDTAVGHPVNSDRVIFVAPGIRALDAAARPPTTVTLPGAYAAASVAGLLASLPAHVSPTNKPLPVAGLETTFIAPELAQLVRARVLALEDRNGPRIVKGITTSTNTAWQQITTRRIVDYAKYGIRSACEPYIGLLNNTRVRGAMRTTVNSFLTTMVNAEMLTAYTLDVTATRQEEIQGIARVTIALRPVFSIDYIQVTMFLE